jgi:hypothetical protein
VWLLNEDFFSGATLHPLNPRPVRLAYQPPASSIFLSQQTSHQQPASNTLLSEQTNTSYQPPANRIPENTCSDNTKNEGLELAKPK